MKINLNPVYPNPKQYSHRQLQLLKDAMVIYRLGYKRKSCQK